MWAEHDCPSEETAMKDFFISFNEADRAWAGWIAWTLEEAGYTVVFQDWDFRPGGNFVLEMHRALQNTGRTIIVVSDAFLKSAFTAAEWAAVLRDDPDAKLRKLIPVRVAECKPDGLLGPIAYVDLVGAAEEEATGTLLGAFSERAKPIRSPGYPGRALERHRYPGRGRNEPPLVVAGQRSALRNATKIAVLAGVIAAVVGLTVTFRQVPKRTDTGKGASSPSVEASRLMLAGFIQDDQGDPLPNVRVVLPELNLETATDSRGRFVFTQVSNRTGATRLIARKPCFQTWTADAPIGDSGFSFVLRRAPCAAPR
jgi:hypothetical protein